MRLAYFTDMAYDRLFADVDKNAEKYLSDEDWLEPYFFGAGEYFKYSSVVVDSFSPYYANKGKLTDAQKPGEDLQNIIQLYGAFKALTPWQAANKYMWTYLCHADLKCREYIKHRWFDDARENTIRTRYFVGNNESLRNDNALSRLWWYGYLTYDADAPNPYWLTKILMTNETIATDVIDTLNRTNFNRIKGVLLAIDDFKNQLKPRESLIDIVRRSNKSLNRYAAVTAMDFLSYEEIRDIALGFLKQAQKDIEP
jgi:hypothetical protein